MAVIFPKMNLSDTDLNS